MTRLLESALEEARKLPEPDQDAIAALIMEQIADDRAWDEKFAATTEDQWARMLAAVREDIAIHGTVPVEDILPPDEPSQ